jgi:hypothetical protein
MGTALMLNVPAKLLVACAQDEEVTVLIISSRTLAFKEPLAHYETSERVDESELTIHSLVGQ